MKKVHLMICIYYAKLKLKNPLMFDNKLKLLT